MSIKQLYSFLFAALLAAGLPSKDSTAAAGRAVLTGMTHEELAARYDPVSESEKIEIKNAAGAKRPLEWLELTPQLSFASVRRYWLDEPRKRSLVVPYDGRAPRYITVGFNDEGQAVCIAPNFTRPAEFTRFIEDQAMWRKRSQSHILESVFPAIRALEERTIVIPNVERRRNGEIVLLDPHELEKHETERARVVRHIRYTIDEETYATYIEKEDSWDRTYRQKYEPVFILDSIRRGKRKFQPKPKPPEITECMLAEADTFWKWIFAELQAHLDSEKQSADKSRSKGAYLQDLSYEKAALQQLGTEGIRKRFIAAVAAAIGNHSVSIKIVEDAAVAISRSDAETLTANLIKDMDTGLHRNRNRSIWVLGILKHANPAVAGKLPGAVKKRIAELQRTFDKDGNGGLSSDEIEAARAGLSE